MGIWGTDVFQNDAALDWVIELEESDDLELIQMTFDYIEHDLEFLDDDECADALAAVEVVAAMLGRPTQSLPEEVRAWLSSHPITPGQELVAQAQRVAEKVRENSLWDVSVDLDAWFDVVDDLLERVA